MTMPNEFPIERGNVARFRAAFGSVDSPDAAGAAREGEIVFRETTVFAEEYLDFCDAFAASRRYPAAAREAMARRRAAIAKVLGRPVLHGGVSYRGLEFNAFVDADSGEVLCWERDDPRDRSAAGRPGRPRRPPRRGQLAEGSRLTARRAFGLRSRWR